MTGTCDSFVFAGVISRQWRFEADSIAAPEAYPASTRPCPADELNWRRKRQTMHLDVGDAGIKTFLIADVRGYTHFTQQRGDEAAAELATRFAAVARACIEAGGGRLVELRGDEALAVFESARTAIRTAIELQRQFVEQTVADPSLPLAVGIGLDAGEAVPVTDGYRGGALNLAARLCSLAAPGEVLASREVTLLARRVEGVAYVDHAAVRLKGIAEPVPVIALRSEPEDSARAIAFRRALGATAVVAATGARNPYKGLRAFDEADAEDFFGREGLTEHLVDRLARTRFLAVVGPSGSGKSSVVRAGLVPALRRGSIEGSEHWTIVQMFPGAYPLEELEAVLLKAAADPPTSLIEQLEEGERGLVRALKRILPDDDTELVVVLDQLEEVFTLVEDESRRIHFLGLLERAVTDPKSRLRVVTTLRADFYDRPLLYSGFAELLRDYVEALVPLTPEEFERAIVRPAERAGLAFEPGLLAEMVADVANEPGALPLLQYALTELYERREGGVLTRDTYRAIGGVSGALAGRAEEIYSGLTDAAQEATRQLFLRLVTLGEGSEDTRRRVERAELDAMQVDQDALGTAIDGFGSSRLLSFDRDPRSGRPTVEVAHEALLREWLRLRRWIDSAREDLRMHRRLAAGAREWAEAGNDRSFLLRGSQLAQFDALADESRIALTELERAFVTASREAGRQELLRQQRENRRLRVLLGVAAVLLVLSIAAGIVALLQRSSAKHQATVALARELGAKAVVEPRLDRAMLLAHEAVNLDDSRETQGTLLSTLLRSPAAISTLSSPITDRPQTVTLSPDGRTLVVVENTNLARFYDTHARRERRPPLPNAVHLRAAFSKDGKYLLVPRASSAAAPPAVDVLDGRTLRHLRFLPIDQRWLNSYESFAQVFLVSPDDARAYLVYSLVDPKTGTDLKTYVDVWSIRTGKRLRSQSVGTRGVFDARFDGAGKLELLADDVVVTLDPTSLRRIDSRPLKLPVTSAVGTGTLSPDARRAAIAQPTGAVSFVDLASGRITNAAGKTGVAVQAIAYSPNGRVVLTTDEIGRVTVWAPETADVLETFAGHEDRVLGIAFTSDGRTVYTCSLDGAIFAWDLGGKRRFGRPFDVPAASVMNYDVQSPLPPLAVSGDGATFATRLAPLQVGLYSLATLGEQRSFTVSTRTGSAITSLAWSPTRAVLAVGQTNDSVELWSLAGRPHLARTLSGLPRATKQLGVSVAAVAFSPDGSLVAAIGYKHTPGSAPPLGLAAVWRSDDGVLLWKEVRRAGPGDTLAFSQDGRRLALSFERWYANDGVDQIVSARTGAHEQTIRPAGSSQSLAFAPGGTLATGSWQGILQLWSASGRELGRPLLALPAPVASISFGPHGDEFATGGGSGGFVKLWDTRTLQQVGTALPGSAGKWANALFTRGGSELLTLYDDGRGALWPMTIGAWKAQACRVAGRNLTREEWSRFVTGRGYSTVCP
jgi:class 3 adenylate cyclase/WD40 repeat protein